MNIGNMYLNLIIKRGRDKIVYEKSLQVMNITYEIA